MNSKNIWAVALAATVSVACGNGKINDSDNTAIGTSGTDQAATPDPGRAAAMARANDADGDRAFVEKIGQAHVAETKLGQLAASRASNAQVKQFASRMVSDHQKANSELKQIASKMAVQLPADLDAKHQELYDRLSKLKGAEFDREYMTAMVNGHREVLSELERHAGGGPARSVGTSGDANAAHASVTGYAKKMVPDVRQHLEQAEQVSGKL